MDRRARTGCSFRRNPGIAENAAACRPINWRTLVQSLSSSSPTPPALVDDNVNTCFATRIRASPIVNCLHELSLPYGAKRFNDQRATAACINTILFALGVSLFACTYFCFRFTFYHSEYSSRKRVDLYFSSTNYRPSRVTFNTTCLFDFTVDRQYPFYCYASGNPCVRRMFDLGLDGTEVSPPPRSTIVSASFENA